MRLRNLALDRETNYGNENTESGQPRVMLIVFSRVDVVEIITVEQHFFFLFRAKVVNDLR